MRDFAAGCGAELIVDGCYRRGGISVFYGVPPQIRHIWEKAKSGQYIYIDNAYLRPGLYFRVTKNNLQCSGIGVGSAKRLRSLNVPLSHWRKKGKYILVCPHTDYFHRLMLGKPQQDWLTETIADLQQFTDRQIVVRTKDTSIPLSIALANCWALVTPQSNCAVVSLCKGVPVFVTGQSCAAPLANRDLSKIEDPYVPSDKERHEWLKVLANNQFTQSEFRDGFCWSKINGLG